MQPVVGENRAQTRQPPTARAAPTQDNNTTTGSTEHVKRVITQEELYTLEDTLQHVQRFLEDTGSSPQAQILESALEDLRRLPKLTPELQCLERITTIAEDIQKTVKKNPANATTGSLGRSWADIAAGAPSHTYTPTTSPNPPKNPADEITLRPSEGNTQLRNAKNPKEILSIISKPLNYASPVAARKMRSGDIRVTVTNKGYVTKNRESIQHQIDAKILREDYPVEVLAVPRSLAIQEGKEANNSTLLRELSTANGKITPGIQFTRISWIPQRLDQPTKTRGSLILSVANHEHQKEVVRRGVVIEGQLFQARLYDFNLRLTRCFNCSRWGHTQGQCPEPHPTCGHCGEQHTTKECQNTRATFCANCKSRSHKAWEVKHCRVFQHLKMQTRQRRISLLYESDQLRDDHLRENTTKSSTPTFEFSSTQAGEKRKAPTQGRTAPVGRPRLFPPARLGQGQTTLASVLARNTLTPSTPASSADSFFTSSMDSS